ncbi:hypothetical protein BDF14DRAFT_1720884 [Spinellus fusiger]|nr:hypothetical protein BDF14DRAFT_1720884 [Spinellus fusiger]
MSASKFICAITAVDSYRGYCLAYNFLKRQEKGEEKHTIRLLCKDKTGLEDLKKMGGEIYEVNYSDTEDITEVLKGVHALIFLPEESEDPINDVERLIKIALNQEVKCITMVSCVGVDKLKDYDGEKKFPGLEALCKLEHKLQEHAKNIEWSIVRSCVPTQCLFYMSPMINNDRKLHLPVDKCEKWGSVDIQDVSDAIYELARKHREEKTIGKKHIWNLTPVKNMNGQEFAQAITEGFDSGKIRFEKSSEDELRDYLKSLRNNDNFQNPPPAKNLTGHSDSPYNFPLARYLTDDFIEHAIENFRLFNAGLGDTTSTDLKELINRDPQDVKEFAKNNQNELQNLK